MKDDKNTEIKAANSTSLVKNISLPIQLFNNQYNTKINQNILLILFRLFLILKILLLICRKNNPL